MWVPFGSKERQKTTITTMHCAVRINTGHLSFRREKNKNTHGTELWFLINQRILILQLSINSVSVIIRTETLLCCFLFLRHKICFLSLVPVECPSTFYLKLQDAKIGQFRINWHETERVVNQQWSRFHLVKVQKGCFSQKAAQSKHFLSDITHISSMTSHFVDWVWASYHETLFLLLILLHTLLFSVNSLDSSECRSLFNLRQNQLVNVLVFVALPAFLQLSVAIDVPGVWTSSFPPKSW